MGDETKFELRLMGKLNPATVKPAAENPALAQRRQDQETGRRLANEFADEALLTLVTMMRSTMDENVKFRCANKIMDRAWGQTKALTEEEKKGADAGSILDVLAAMSSTQAAVEREVRGQVAVSHDAKTINTEAEALQFFDELNGKLDDIEDGVVIDG